MIDISTEIQQLHHLLSCAQHTGRTLGDMRLRMYLTNKLRHLEADLTLRSRPGRRNGHMGTDAVVVR